MDRASKFFRVSATSLALKVARSFFSDSLQVMALARAFSSTMLSMVGCRVTGNALIELTRQAFERGRQLIIVTRAEEGDREIDNLSGPRAIAPQQDGKRAEDFLWSEHLARQHLNRTVTTEFKKRQDVLLSS